MPPEPIYLDAHATTPPDPRVVDAMLPVLRSTGNAGSLHAAGRRARDLVEDARARVAALIGADPREIVFTSGATEADNLAIKGAALAARPGGGGHVIAGQTEHRAVLDSCLRLEQRGFRITWLAPRADGRVMPEDVEAALTTETVLVSLMAANNEIGVIHPYGEIASLLAERGIPYHCDAVQALAWMDLPVTRHPFSLLSLSAHKMYGPQGVGALYVRRRRPRVRLEPLIDGGGQERGLRPGTLDVAGIVGMGRAAELALAEREADALRVARLRDALHASIARRLDGRRAVRLNGSAEHRLPSNLSLTFPGIPARAIVARAEGICVSSGSACSTGSADTSYVIRCLPGSDDAARWGGVRIGLHRFTTEAEIEPAAATLASAVESAAAAPEAAAACDGA